MGLAAENFQKYTESVIAIHRLADKYDIGIPETGGLVIVVCQLLNKIVGYSKYMRKNIAENSVIIVYRESEKLAFSCYGYDTATALLEFVQNVELLHKLELLEK